MRNRGQYFDIRVTQDDGLVVVVITALTLTAELCDALCFARNGVGYVRHISCKTSVPTQDGDISKKADVLYIP